MANPIQALRRRRSKRALDRASDRGRVKGFARALLLVVALLASVVPVLFLASAISYVPLIMVVTVLAVSLVGLALTQRGVHVEEAVALGSCERGESVPINIRIVNGAWFPIPRMEIYFFISDLGEGNDAVTSVRTVLAPRETLDLGFNACFAHLGSYRVGIDHVIVYDLLGLFSRSIDVGNHGTVDVRPRLFDVGNPDLTNVTSLESSKMFRPIIDDGMDYSSVREYRWGDPLKTVHWKLSGRGTDDKMFTRLFEVHTEPGLAIIIDPYAPSYEMDELMGAFDSLVESAASIARAAQELGVDAEVRYIGKDGAPAAIHLAKLSDVDDLIHNMMPARPAEGDLNANVASEMLLREMRSPQGKGNIAFCTSRLGEESVGALVSMRMHMRNPMCFMAVPRTLETRRRETAVKPLSRLAAAGVPYYVVETNEAVTEVKAS